MITMWIINGKSVPDKPSRKFLERMSVKDLVSLAEKKIVIGNSFKKAIIEYILLRDGSELH